MHVKPFIFTQSSFAAPRHNDRLFVSRTIVVPRGRSDPARPGFSTAKTGRNIPGRGTMRNLMNVFDWSYGPKTAQNDSRRASYAAVHADRGPPPVRRNSHNANRRKSLDPATAFGRRLFDGRLVDPRTRNTCK